VAGVDARRATPPDPRPPRWGLAGYCQLDPSHPAIVTCEGSDFEPCPFHPVEWLRKYRLRNHIQNFSKNPAPGVDFIPPVEYILCVECRTALNLQR